MFKPLSLCIGFRYTRAKTRNHFISFISLISMLGIALGVGVLITVLSVMNGFDHEVKARLFSMARHVTVRRVDAQPLDWPALSKTIEKLPGVVATAPFIDGQGMIVHNGTVYPLLLTGVIPTLESKVSPIVSHFVEGHLSRLRPGDFSIVLGDTLANQLNVSVGDKVTVVTPQASLTPIGFLPHFKRFKIVGLFHVGNNMGYDTQVGFLHWHDANQLFNKASGTSGLRLKVSGLYIAPRIAQTLRQRLSNAYFVTDWTVKYGAFFKAIRMEKTMMFLILFLIIVVAAFNLVSSLVMTVTDKKADIAILRTLGMTPTHILSIFIIQGAIIGIVGTLIGIGIGVVLSLNVTSIVSSLEQFLRIKFLSPSVYFIDFLPSRLMIGDVLHIAGLSIVLSLCATIYPAWKASRVQPAEALRYE